MLYTYMYIVCILYMYILCIFATTRGATSHRRRGSDIHWKDWCWNWSSNTLTTWCEELTNWKRPWCWERLKVGGEGDNRRWGGWMASPPWWTWVWASFRSWWWTGKLLGVSKSWTQLSNWTTLSHREEEVIVCRTDPRLCEASCASTCCFEP